MICLKMINLILIYKLLQIDLKRTLRVLKAMLHMVIIFKINKIFKIIIFNSQIKKPLMKYN